MSVTRAASSTIDMLCLEYPQNIKNVHNDTYPENDSVEIWEPLSCLHQLAHQHQLAQTDLQRPHHICGGKFDQNDHCIRSIERSYQTLFQGLRYIYEQAKADVRASHKWMQTELMLVANAPQQFTVEVWQVILTRNDKAGQQAMYQTIQTTRINDALAFLQMADLHRNHEKKRLRTKVDSTQAALRQVAETGQPKRRTLPSYLQAAPVAMTPRRIRPPVIPMEEAEPPQDQPTALRTPDDTRQAEENPDECLVRILSETIADTRSAQVTRMTNPCASTRLPAPRVVRLKLENPTKFDRKPKMPFRTWWDSVRDYIRFYLEISGIQRIAWIGTLLTERSKGMAPSTTKASRRC